MREGEWGVEGSSDGVTGDKAGRLGEGGFSESLLPRTDF